MEFRDYLKAYYDIGKEAVLWQAGYDTDYKDPPTIKDVGKQIIRLDGKLAFNKNGDPMYTVTERRLASGRIIYGWNVIGVLSTMYAHEYGSKNKYEMDTSSKGYTKK